MNRLYILSHPPPSKKKLHKDDLVNWIVNQITGGHYEAVSSSLSQLNTTFERKCNMFVYLDEHTVTNHNIRELNTNIRNTVCRL